MKKTAYFRNAMGVFQGGGLKAIAFIGAYREAHRHGVFFSEVAGTSAGSIFAALIAAGATPDFLEELVKKTDFNDFLGPTEKEISKYGSSVARIFSPILRGRPKIAACFLGNLGLYSSASIEQWMEEQLRNLLGLNRDVMFGDLNMPLHVVATDLKKRRHVIWSSSNTPEIRVAEAVRCSCTIPFFFQPVDKRYVDGGLVSNLPAFAFNIESQVSANYERVLCFSLDDSTGEEPEFGYDSYVNALANTIVDGAVTVQGVLQRDLHHVVIADLPLKTTDFQVATPDLVERTIKKGEKAAKTFFERESAIIKLSSSHQNTIRTFPQALNELVLTKPNEFHSAIIAFENCELAYKLFPTFFHWASLNKSVVFHTLKALPVKPRACEHERLRRLVLRSLGVQVLEHLDIPFEGAVFVSETGRDDKAVIFHKGEKLDWTATRYIGRPDEIAIKALREKLTNPPSHEPAIGQGMNIKALDEAYILDAIRNVTQYRRPGVEISMKTIPLGEVSFLTRYIKSYKYNQIRYLFDAFDRADVPLFEPCAWEGGGSVFPITPPVVEKHGDTYHLLEGNSRLSYCAKELCLSEARVVVVEGVEDPLPSNGAFGQKRLIISDTNRVGGERYENFVYDHYRWIEEAVRRPGSYLEK